MVLKEKSGYLRVEVLSRNFFESVKKSLEQIKKERRYTLPLNDLIRKRA